MLTLFLFGLDEAFFPYVLTLFLLVLANLLGIILPRISPSREMRALYSFIYSPSLPFTSFTHIKRKPFLVLKVIGMIWWLLHVGERKIIFFILDAFCSFQGVQAGLLLTEIACWLNPLTKFLHWTYDTCGDLMVGTGIISLCSAGEQNVCRRDENEQKTVLRLSIVISNILMGIDKIQLIWRVLSRSIWIIWNWRIFCRCENDSS